MPQGAAAVTLPYRWPRSLAVRVGAIRHAIARVLDEPRYQVAARQMAATLAAERDEGLVVDELERVALERAVVSH